MTRRALARARPRLAPAALASIATLHPRNLDFRAHPEHGFFEGDLQVVAHIFAALRPGLTATPAALPEQVAKPEEVAQNVAEIGEGLRVELRTARARTLHPGVPEPVVRRAFLRVAEHAVRLAGFFEFLLRQRIFLIPVGVVALGEDEIGGGEFLGGDRPDVDPEPPEE